eukprot:774958-Rhodomonas_salina.1
MCAISGQCKNQRQEFGPSPGTERHCLFWACWMLCIGMQAGRVKGTAEVLPKVLLVIHTRIQPADAAGPVSEIVVPRVLHPATRRTIITLVCTSRQNDTTIVVPPSASHYGVRKPSQSTMVGLSTV